jgi:hypothetical protein
MNNNVPFFIDDAKRVQRDFALLDVHVAFINIGDGSFSLAHTDAERNSRMNLWTCEIHEWLKWLTRGNPGCCCFPETGWYEIEALHEAKGIAL